MSGTDVRVRLTPLGVKEVIAALRQVQREGQRSNTVAGRGISALQKELAGLKRLLPTIGLATAVTGVVLLGRQALNAAAAMNDLSRRTGGSTENLSVFVREAELADATIGDVQQGLSGLATNLERLRRGEDSATEGFGALGLAAQDFTRLDTVQAAVKIGEALASMEDPARRAALAKETLGKAGTALLPTLLNLADKGFATASAEAAKLGLVIDQDLADAASAANDSMTIIGQQVRGVALQFVAGLAPAITQTMQTFSDETAGRGVESISRWGQITGRAIGLVMNLLRLLAGAATGTFEVVGAAIASTAAASVQAIRGNFGAALVILREGGTDIARTLHETFAGAFEDVEKLMHDLSTDPPKIEPRVRARPALLEEGDGAGVGADTSAVRRARLAAVKQRLDDELALQKAANDRLLDENERAFDRGLVSLDDYTERRREVITRQAEAEIAALKAQRAALVASIPEGTGASAEAERQKLTAELGAADNEIRLRQLALARELADIDATRIDRARELADEQRALANELDELEGNRHAVFARNLEEEIRQIRELGTRAGQTAEEIEATVARFTSARTARFEFEEAFKRGQLALRDLERDMQRVRADAEAGRIREIEAVRQLTELERARLGTLEDISAEINRAAQATGDQEAISRAKDFDSALGDVRDSLDEGADAAEVFQSASEDAFEATLAFTLKNLENFEDLGEALESFARDLSKKLRDIAAEILASQITKSLFGSFGGGPGGGATGAKRGGLVRGYAVGGEIAGRELQLPGPDRVPILAAKGEFMLRRSRVMEPGALSFLRAWNAGQIRLADVMARPRFAQGGVIGSVLETPSFDGSSSSQTPTVSLRNVNVVTDKQLAEALSGSAGESMIMNHITRNETKIRKILNGGA